MNNKEILLLICPPVWEKLPPAGLAYLAQYLRNNGIKVSVFDLNLEFCKRSGKSYQKDWTINRNYNRQEFFDACLKTFPDVFQSLIDFIQLKNISVIGFSILKSNRIFTLSLNRWLKKQGCDIKTILGGPETYSMKLEGYQGLEEIDHFVVGEGEKALYSLLSMKNPPGVIEFDPVENLDFYPDYSDFDLSIYPRNASLPIITSRGCYNLCNFCSEKLLYSGYRFRDAQNVFQEILYHFNKNRIKWFVFYDSLFNGNLENLEKLLDLIIDSGIKIVWDAQISVRTDMSYELLLKMKKSGCINLFIGFESGSDTILRLMNKRFSVNTAARFFESLNQAGLQFEISLIAHYPGETEVEFKETLNFLVENSKNIKKIAQISLFRDYPGTHVLVPNNYQEKEGLLKIDRLVKVLKDNGIAYTASYINNLI